MTGKRHQRRESTGSNRSDGSGVSIESSGEVTQFLSIPTANIHIGPPPSHETDTRIASILGRQPPRNDLGLRGWRGVNIYDDNGTGLGSVHFPNTAGGNGGLSFLESHVRSSGESSKASPQQQLQGSHTIYHRHRRIRNHSKRKQQLHPTSPEVLTPSHNDKLSPNALRGKNSEMPVPTTSSRRGSVSSEASANQNQANCKRKHIDPTTRRIVLYAILINIVGDYMRAWATRQGLCRNGIQEAGVEPRSRSQLDKRMASLASRAMFVMDLLAPLVLKDGDYLGKEYTQVVEKFFRLVNRVIMLSNE
ncbi:hypothetical protein K445DRAFT_322596 [Daldinia sp. EC12]|nr:hypothetical protein K445DRAFT_322596 [Daldinia sp. EC12]